MSHEQTVHLVSEDIFRIYKRTLGNGPVKGTDKALARDTLQTVMMTNIIYIYIYKPGDTLLKLSGGRCVCGGGGGTLSL